jgi:hypothetical protein
MTDDMPITLNGMAKWFLDRLPFQGAEIKPAAEVRRIENFIEGYAEYADVLEAPRVMHEVVATQIVASILNRNGVVIRNGAGTHSLDLWVLLLSGSGHGRSTLVSQVHAVLASGGVNDLIRDAAWGSEAAFIQNMAENPAGLFVWGELSEKLKKLSDSGFAGLKEWLTDRYDDLRVPEDRRYRRTGKSNDTPTIEFKEAPRINILATSSEAWFFENLEEEDSAGGFIPRWLLVRSPARTRSVPIPKELDAAKEKALGACLAKIAGLRGVPDISAIQPLYAEWYTRAQRSFEEQANKALAAAYFNRHRIHVLKLAVVYEAAASQQLIVTEDSWNRAVRMAGELQQTIFSLLDTGMNSTGYGIKQMEERIQGGGEAGLSKSELTRAFQNVPNWEREDRIKTLRDAGTIHQESRQTGGREATVYIHKDFKAREVPVREE